MTSTADKPSSTDSDHDGVPDYVENKANEFEFVHSAENGTAGGQLGWAEPKSDGVQGTGVGKTDVYIAQIGDEGIYGYAASEEDSVSSDAYLGRAASTATTGPGLATARPSETSRSCPRRRDRPARG